MWRNGRVRVYLTYWPRENIGAIAQSRRDRSGALDGEGRWEQTDHRRSRSLDLSPPACLVVGLGQCRRVERHGDGNLNCRRKQRDCGLRPCNGHPQFQLSEMGTVKVFTGPGSATGAGRDQNRPEETRGGPEGDQRD